MSAKCQKADIRLFNERIGAFSDRSSHEFFAIRSPDAVCI
jgi:hypothetical protein